MELRISIFHQYPVTPTLSGTNILPHHPVLKYPQSVFFLQGERPCFTSAQSNIKIKKKKIMFVVVV
jgi:hypothetical protein